MKKRFGLSMMAVIVLVFLLVGCQTAGVTTENTTEPPATTPPLTAANPTLPEAAEASFDKIFAVNQLTDRMKRQAFFERLGECRYQGELMSDIAKFATWDGYDGSGDLYTVDGVLRAESSQTRNVPQEYEDRTNTAKLLASVDGFVLPYGLEFGSSLDALLAKLELSFDYQNGFSEKNDTVTLWSQSDSRMTVTVVLVDRSQTSEDGAISAGYDLIYTEIDTVDAEQNIINSRSVTMEYRESVGLSSVIFCLNSRTLTEFGFLVCLDSLCLYSEMTQSSFLALYHSYTYQGESIKDLDGYDGGLVEEGQNGSSFLISIPNVIAGENSRQIFDGENGGYAVKRSALTFFAPIDQMPKPHGITFGTSLDGALEALGITLDFENEFVASEEDPAVMILKRETYDRYLFEWRLIDEGRSADEQGSSRRYRLQYTVTYSLIDSDGQEERKTRCVEIGFDRQSDTVIFIAFVEETRIDQTKS